MKALFCILLALLCAGCTTPQEQASIGIIGGADGPTTIFLAGSFDSAWLLIAAVAVVVVAVVLIVRRRKRQ